MVDGVYRHIFDALPEAVLLYALSGECLACNPAACQLLGYTAAECRHFPLPQLFHPDWLPSFNRLMPAITAGEKFQAQGRLVRKNGASFTADIKAAPFAADGHPCALLVIRDVTFEVTSQRFLEQQAAEQTQELKTLLEISHNITLTLDMASLLGMILDQLARVIAYDGATVLVLEGEHLIPRAYRGPAPEALVLSTRYSIHDASSQAVLNSPDAMIVADMQQDKLTQSQAAPAARELFETILGYVRGWMATAITIKGRAVGILIVHHRQPNAFNEAHAEKIKAFAYQAAVVIENARLYEQAQQLAAWQERQKLARELHDSVSQALYGIGLGARTAQALLERDPAQAVEPLAYVLSLAEAGLAEMRALIFELRPESLAKEGLAAALEKQATVLRTRHQLEVTTTLMAEPDVSLPAKEAFFRIAQEALHNVVKHANASQVTLRLQQERGQLILEVQDNGRGFDAAASFPGHLGLQSMRERIERLGGQFYLESAVEKGTMVRATLRLPAG